MQGNRVLTKEHLEQVILNPAGFQPFTLKSPFQAGLLLQQIEGYLAQDCQVLGTMVPRFHGGRLLRTRL